MTLILASASPRRRALLSEAGFEFVVEVADVDETLSPGIDPLDAVIELAGRKAATVARRHTGEAVHVLGADTVVASASGRTLLGKPADAGEARRSLEALSGTRHQVLTGVALWTGPGGELRARAERTWVTMREIAPEEIEAYVASGEWRDKAGGYAIQETADAFVTSLEEGGFDNVVGLPVGLVRELLREAGFAG